MSKLATFLKDKAVRWGSETTQRLDVLDDWKKSVDRFLTTIEGWVREADSDQIVIVNRHAVTRSEHQLGFYSVDYLTLECGAARIHFVPARRYGTPAVWTDETGSNRIPTAGYIRIVEGKEPDITNSDPVVYRVADGDTDTWYIRHGDRYCEFDREYFEALLVGSFR